MAQLIDKSLDGGAGLLREGRSFTRSSIADTDLEDLIYAWHRLGNPALLRVAVRLIRTLGEDHPGQDLVSREMT